MPNNVPEIDESRAYVDKLRNEYIENHVKEQERDELIGENNIEKRDIKGYHGREILELLQNADDAYQKSIDLGRKPAENLTVSILYLDGVLSVKNTGTCFDKEGIKSVVQGNNSTKEGNYIGNKGTGFRSILNWASQVRILSGSFSVQFSKQIAANIFHSIENETQIKKQKEKQKNLYIPMLAVPMNLDTNKVYDDTTIEIDIDPDKLNDDYSVDKQLANLDLRILLFLPNVRSIEIETTSKKTLYSKCISYDKGLKVVTLCKNVNGEDETQESFYLFEKRISKRIEIDNKQKDMLLSVAVPLDFDTFKRGYLYSFFPLLETKSPFNCVLHASYLLGDHRNNIPMNEVNKEIICEQIRYLIDIANTFVGVGKYNIAQQLLTPEDFEKTKWNLPVPFDRADIKDLYLDLVSDQKMFLSVNGDALSINDGIKTSDCKLPNCFKGVLFNDLVNQIDSTRIYDFMVYMLTRKEFPLFYSEQSLCDIINQITDTLSITDQVDVFIWWNRKSGYKSLLPRLLKSQDNSWIEANTECYFLIGSFDEKAIPSWVKVPALAKEYQTEILNKSEELDEVIWAKENEPRTERIICQNKIYPLVNFMYRDRSTIIQTVNASVDSYDKAIEFVKWLWEHYGTEDETWTPPIGNNTTKIKYHFPCYNGGVTDSDSIFLGKNYGNPLGNKLCQEDYHEFVDFNLLGISQDDKEAFKTFILKFSLVLYPVIEVQDIEPISEYKEYIRKTIFETEYMGSSTSFKNIRYNLPYIKNLDKILCQLTTTEVIEWIRCDEKMFDVLSQEVYLSSSGAQITYTGNLQHSVNNYKRKLKNYILEIFNVTEWIKIGDKKYSPREVLKNYEGKTNGSYKLILPVWGMKEIETVAKNVGLYAGDVTEIFNLFSLCDNVTDLSSNEFYGLLLKIQEMGENEGGKLAQNIYGIIEQSSFSKEYSDSENKRLFEKNGKMLVKYQGKYQFFPAKDAVLPSLKIISKNEFPIVVKGQRSNNDNFVRVFGCKKYESDYKILFESIKESKADKDFQEYFSEYIKFAMPYSHTNTNIEKYLPTLTISLVKQISVCQDDVIYEYSEENSCLRASISKWYIYAPEERFDERSVSIAIENIISSIANVTSFDASKFGELFRTRTREDREFILRKDGISLTEIDDSAYQDAMKVNFLETLRKMGVGCLLEDEASQMDMNDTLSVVEYIQKLENIDITDIEANGFVYNIDFSKYYLMKIESYLRDELENFKNWYYSKAIEDTSLQKSFVQTVDAFVEYQPESIPHSARFDYISCIQEKFGVWEKIEISSDDEYIKNYERMNSEDEFSDEIANDTNAQNMIYFSREDDFNAWIEKHRNEKAKETMGKIDPYASLRGVVPSEKALVFHQDKGNKGRSSGNRKGTFTESENDKQNKRKKEQGNKGELVVYTYLCDKYGEANVFPRSEAYVTLGLLKPGQAKSGEYDISYKDKISKEHFVEVKTSNSGKSFFITVGELDFAKKHPDQFEIILVTNLDNEIPDISVLPKRFWTDKRFRKTEIIKDIEFDF